VPASWRAARSVIVMSFYVSLFIAIAIFLPAVQRYLPAVQ
jgi:hypothetical protein